MSRRRRNNKSSRDRAAQWTAWAMVCLFGFVATMWATGLPQPPRLHFFRLLWVLSHEPVFYVLLMLAGGAMACTVLAMKIPGRHRAALLLSWVLGVAMIFFAFSAQVEGMWKVIWWRMNR